MAVTVAFAIFIVIGWLVIAYLAFLTPGGLQGAWEAVRNLNIIIQILMWLLFLPWMIALWIFNTGLPLWVRLLIILGLVWVTYFMAIPPLIQMLRSRG